MTDPVKWLECANVLAVTLNLSSFGYVMRSIYLLRQQRRRMESCLRVLGKMGFEAPPVPGE